jgi:MFS family permease
VGIFLPQILKLGNLSDLEVGFLSSASYVFASVGMILWAGHVDRGGNKVTNLALACLLGAVGLFCAVWSTNFWVSFGWLTVSLVGINAARGIFFTIPMRFLTGIALAGGLAFINSIGTSGGFVGPYIFGWLTDETGSYTAGLAAMSAFLLAAAGMAVSLKLFVTQE